VPAKHPKKVRRGKEEKVVYIFVVVLAQETPKWYVLFMFEEAITCGDIIFEDCPHEKLGLEGRFELPYVLPPELDSLWLMSLG